MRQIIGFLVILFFLIVILREGCGCAMDIYSKVKENQKDTEVSTSIAPSEAPIVVETPESTPIERNSEIYESTSEVIESNIDGEFNGFDSDKIFKLSNGQVWQQDEYKYKYSYKYRPSVTIVKSGIYYKMLVDGMGDAIKVKLIAGSIGKSARPAYNNTPDVIEAYVTSDFRGFSSGNIFKLDNGQVWEQTEAYTYTYTYSRPKIMIYRTGGQYKLKFDNIDRPVTVRKIN